MAETHGERIAARREAGVPLERILSEFKAKYGLDAGTVPPETPMEQLQAAAAKVAPTRQAAGEALNVLTKNRQDTRVVAKEPDGSPVRDDEGRPTTRSERVEPKGFLQRGAEGTAVTLGSIPGMVAGALESFIPSGEFGKQRSLPHQEEAYKHITERFDQSKGMPTGELVTRSRGDALSGLLLLLNEATGNAPHGGENLPFPESIKVGLQHKREVGQQLGGGLGGGTVGMMRNLGVDQAEAIRQDLFGNMMLFAPGLKATAKLGLSKIGKTAAAVDRMVPQGLEHFDDTGTAAARADAAALKAKVDAGEITPQRAASIMEQIHPGKVRAIAQQLQDTGSRALRGAGDALENAATGALVLGDVLPGGMATGAIAGVLLPKGIQAALKALSPQQRAAMQRFLTDPNVQPTDAETMRTREIIEPSQQAQAEVRTLFEEAGGRATQGKVGPAPMPVSAILGGPDDTLMSVRSPADRQFAVKSDGTMQPPLTEIIGAQDLADQADVLSSGMARERALEQAAQAQVKLGDKRPTPEWQALEDQRKPMAEAASKPMPEGRFHGTSSQLPDRLNDMGNEGNALSIYGQGFYTTDSLPTAQGYTKKGRGKDPSIYKVDDGGNDFHLYNLDDPMDASTRDMVAKDLIRLDADGYNSSFYEGEYQKILDNPDATLRQVYDELRQEPYSAEMITETFDNFMFNLQARGYNGFKHVGGDKTGNKPHNVNIYWEPSKDVKVTKVPHFDTPAGRAQLQTDLAALVTKQEQTPATYQAKEQLLAKDAGLARRDARTELADIAGGRTRDGDTTLPVTEGGIDRRAGLVTEPGIEKVKVATNDNVFEAIADRVHQSVNQGARDAPGATPFSRKEVGRWMTDALLPLSLTRLRSPSWRGLLEKRLADKAGLDKAGRKALKAELDNFIVKANEGALSQNPEGIALRLPDGTTVTLRDLGSEVFKEMAADPKQAAELNRMMGEGLDRVGLHVGMQTAETVLARNLAAEGSRFWRDRPEILDGRVAADAVVTGVVAGETMPLLLPFDPRGPGAEMMRTATDPAAVAIAKRLADEYVPLSDAARSFLANAVRRGDIPQQPGELWATKGFAETLDNHLVGTQAAKEAGDLGTALWRQGKLGLTAYNLPTHINNIMSNLIYQSIRLGKTPIGLMVEWYGTGKRWKEYLDGKVDDPKRLQTYRALAKTGFADTHALDIEMTQLGKGSPAGEGAIKTIGRRLGGAARKAYKAGDNIPKLHEAERAFDHITQSLDRMEPGRWVELDLGKNRAVRLVKNQDGTFTGDYNGKARVFKATDDALADLKARAAVKTALDILVDFSSSPRAQTALRKMGPLSAASPFVSWAWWVMDAPGKKGILRHLYDYDGGAMLRTNDLGLLAGRAKGASMLGVRRSAMLQAGKNTLDPDRDELNKTVNPFGANREMPLAHIAMQTAPGEYATKTWQQNNPFGPSDAVWRLGQAAIGRVYAAATGGGPAPKLHPGGTVGKQSALPDAEKAAVFAAMSDEDKRRLRIVTQADTGEDFTSQDAVKLVGVAGGPISHMLEDLARKRQPNEPGPDYGKMALTLAKMYFGSLSSAAETVAGVVDPSQRRDVVNPNAHLPGEPSAKPEDVWDFTIRKMLNTGWTKTVLAGENPATGKAGAVDAYLDNFEAALNTAIDDGAEKAAERMMLKGLDTTEIQAVLAEAFRGKARAAIIAAETRQRFYKAAGRKAKRSAPKDGPRIRRVEETE